MSKSILLIFAFGCFFLMAAAPRPSPFDEEYASPPEIVDIAVVAPFTGAESFSGDALRDGVRLACEEINTRGMLRYKLRIVLRDTRSDTETAKIVAEKIAGDSKVAAIIGGGNGAQARAIAQAAQDAGKPVVLANATEEGITAIGENVFRVCYSDPVQGSALAAFARSRDIKTAATPRMNGDSITENLAKSFRETFEALGGTIVTEILVSLQGNVPGIVFLSSSQQSAAQAIKVIRETKRGVEVFGVVDCNTPHFLHEAGDASSATCYTTDHFSAQNKTAASAAFMRNFTAQYGKPPNSHAALGCDALTIIAYAMAAANSEQSHAIVSAMSGMKNFEGVTGRITMDDTRSPEKPVVILRLENGEFVFVESVAPEAMPLGR